MSRMIRLARTLEAPALRFWGDALAAPSANRNMMLVGCAGGEGVTTLCFAIARAAVLLGARRVLIVDVRDDGAVKRALGVRARDRAKAARAGETPVLRDVEAGVDLLADWRGGVALTELAARGALDHIAALAGDAYDAILWDCSGAAEAATAQLLARRMGSVTLVAQSDKTPRQDVERALAALESVGAPVQRILRNHARRLLTSRILLRD